LEVKEEAVDSVARVANWEKVVVVQVAAVVELPLKKPD